MWVNSKVAAEILGVNVRKIQRYTSKTNKKFLTIYTYKIMYKYIENSRGGNSGKILQIWLDDRLIADYRAQIAKNAKQINGAQIADCGVQNSDTTRWATQSGAQINDNKVQNLDINKNRANLECDLDNINCRAYRNNAGVWENRKHRSKGGLQNLDVAENRLCGELKTDNGKQNLDYELQITDCKNLKKASAKTQNIKELEHMQKIMAINELNSCPLGFKKTLWGKEVAKKYDVSLKTLYEWAKFFKNSDICVKDEKKDIYFRAKFNTSSFDINALEWALSFMLNHPLCTKVKAYEELCNEAYKNSWKIGSYKSFARQMDKSEIKAMLLKASCGDRGVRNEIAPFVRRDLNLYDSLEMICGDQIVFDFDVITSQQKRINPNAFVWIDMGSGAIIGADIVLGKYNKFSVARAMKMALGFGVPDSIYTDNGKPELSNYIKGVVSQLSGIELRDFNEFDPRLIHKKAKPANSRAKPIENIFNHAQRWMREEIFTKKGGVSYHKDNHQKAEIMKKYMKENPLNYDEFICFFANAVKKHNEHYNSERKIVPIKAFISKLESGNKARFDDKTLEYIFSDRREIKVRNSSVKISINKQSYVYSSSALSKFNDEIVEVRVRENDFNSVSIVDIAKNKIICEAYLNEKIDPRDYKALSEKIAENEKVVKAVNEAFRYYKNLTRPIYKINPAYTNMANENSVKLKNSKKLKNKITMSEKELKEAMIKSVGF